MFSQGVRMFADISTRSFTQVAMEMASGWKKEVQTAFTDPV
jgi:hypothetical protein